jgi:predicted permease
MLVLRELVARLWGTLRRGRPDTDLEEELRSHLELAAAAERGRVASYDAVPRAAALKAGALAQSMEAVRDQRGLPWVDDFFRDSRYALRAIRRSPTFAAAALLTLAIGIGANTAIFSVVNGVLLKPLPYPDPERLVAVWQAAPGAPGLATVSGGLRLSLSMHVTYAEQNRTFEHIGLWTAITATVTGVAEPEEVRGVLVTDGTLQALNVQPVEGRWLSPQDQMPGAPETVMLGYGYWQRRFGGDRSVVGRSLTVGARPREVVGVMPKGFRVVTSEPDLILPNPIVRSRLILAGFGYDAVARLKPGVSIAEANADIARMVPVWMRSWPTVDGGNPRVYEAWRITPALRPLKREVVGNVGDVLWLLMGTIGVVLLIACANVTNLLLARAEGRHQEIAVRAALGASTARIIRALLLESVWLGLLGGVLGVGLSYVGLRILVAQGPASLPRLGEIVIIDGRALGFALAVSVLSGAALGLLPAIRSRDARLSTALQGGGRTSSAGRERHRVRSALVVLQVSLALVLLVSSGLMIRTIRALRAVQPGFTHPEQLQTVRISIPPSLIPDAELVERTQNAIVEKLSAIPGVASAGFTTTMPMEGFAADWDIIGTEGRPILQGEMPPLRTFKHVSPGLFSTSGTRQIAGRDFTWTDLYARRNVVIVSENLARELFGTPEAAIGKRVRTVDATPWREIVGVVQDVHENGVHEPAPTIVYWPALKGSLYVPGRTDVIRTVTFAIRTSGAGTEGLMNQMRQAVWSVNPSLPLASLATMQQIVDRSLARTSFTLVMLSIAGAMALLLGIVGIYGVMSYAVSQRTREIGIRLALGANGAGVTGMVVGRGLLLAGAGVAVGLGVAAGVTRLMSSLLFGTSALDPMTFGSASLVLTATAAVASYLPARRAAAVDPVQALKAE